MCDNDKMHSFDANLSVVSSYIDDLKGHPDDSFIILDAAKAAQLSGNYDSDCIREDYLRNALEVKMDAAFANTPPCVVLQLKHRGNDLCLVVTIYRQGYDSSRPVMKGNPGLLSSNYDDCLFFFEDHANLSSLRYERDLNRYANALNNITVNTVIEPCECMSDQYKKYWFDQSQLRYQSVSNYLASSKVVKHHAQKPFAP